MHKLDHIVFAASTLEEGTLFIENELQVKLSDIGFHNDMGTYNRVVKISKTVYLEVISIDPNFGTPKYKRWFNLDNSKLQTQLRKSPQVIGYVIENEDEKILRYYEPFIKVSRDDYKWKFAMPSTKMNIAADQSYKNNIIPSIIYWESEKPVNKMQDNHLELENLEITLTENQLVNKNFINSLGAIEKLEFLTVDRHKNLSMNDFPKMKINIKDKRRNIIITL